MSLNHLIRAIVFDFGQTLVDSAEGFRAEREIPIYALGKGPLAVRPRSNSEVASWIFNRK